MFLKIITIIITITIITTPYKVSDFKPSLFKPTLQIGFQDVQTGNDKIGQIKVFADINGDHYNDYIAVPDKKGVLVYVYLWSQKLSSFIKSQFKIQKIGFQTIQQIITADLDSDGKCQIIITYQIPNQTFQLQIYHTQECLYQQQQNNVQKQLKCNFKYFQTNVNIFNNMSHVPFLLDPTGQGKVNIVSIFNQERYLSTLSNGKQFTKELLSSVFTNVQGNTFDPISKHFASIIDIDGNCQSDLLIISQLPNNISQFQFYIKRTQISKYQRKDNGKFIYNKKIIFLTFVDIDNNAGTDLVMIIEDQNKNKKIMISYNYNKVLYLCTIEKESQEIPYHLQDQNLQELIINKNLTSSSSNSSFEPIDSLHFGDINNDGFPDLFAIFKQQGFKKVYLLINTLNSTTQKRQFSQDQYTKKITAETTNPYQVSFFDYAEDGKLDLLLIINQNQQNSGNGQQVTKALRKSIINNLQEDTLFIKILPLSPTSNYESRDYSISSAFGVTIQWVITLLDGSKKVQLLNQKSQFNYGALQLPFSLGGLGRTNNYVQDLTVGYQGKDNIKDWSPVIPNSQLMVYRRSQQWKLQTLLTDNDRVYQVIYISIAILIILAIVVLLLGYRQTLQDKKDHYNVIQLIR